MFIETLSVIIIFFGSIIFHECAHGWVAYRLGDPTAKLAGRLTLNPYRHIDILGMIIVPFILKSIGLFPLGWAKPVPVTFANLNSPKRDMIFVATAGPLVNILLAGISCLLIKLNLLLDSKTILIFAFEINLILAIFNLIPIPPLDGSRIVMGVLPRNLNQSYSQLEPFGLIIVLVLLNYGLFDFILIIVELIANQLGIHPTP